jgi:hypothetical protein
MKDHLRAKMLSTMTPAQIEAALAEIKAFKDARASAGPTPG